MNTMAHQLRPGDIITARSLVAIMREYGEDEIRTRAYFTVPACETLTVNSVEHTINTRGKIIGVEINFDESRIDCYDVGASESFEVVGYHATYDELMTQLAAMPAHTRDNHINFTQLMRMTTIRPPTTEQDVECQRR